MLLEYIATKVAVKVVTATVVVILNCKPLPHIEARRPYKVILIGNPNKE